MNETIHSDYSRRLARLETLLEERLPVGFLQEWGRTQERLDDICRLLGTNGLDKRVQGLEQAQARLLSIAGVGGGLVGAILSYVLSLLKGGGP